MMCMFLVQKYRALVWIFRVSRIYGLVLERNLDLGRYSPLLFSDTCMGLIVQFLCVECNLHNQYHILDLHPVLIIKICGYGRP